MLRLSVSYTHLDVYKRQHYSNEEVSLDTVCEALGVSNSYFSTIFKKETGKSFIGYLTDYRMERASRLLLETNEKSYLIGKKVDVYKRQNPHLW